MRCNNFAMPVARRRYRISRTSAVLLLLGALTLLFLRDGFAQPLELPNHDLEYRSTEQYAASSVTLLRDPEVSLQKRGGDYDTDQMEGFSLMCLMEGDTLPPEYAPNPSVAHQGATVGDVGAYGWGRIADAFEPSDVPHSVRAAFAHMGAPSILDQSWDMVTWSQLYPVPRENPKWEPTGATFKNFFNCDHGVLVAIVNEGPLHVKNPPPKDKITPLRQWSEIMAFEWWDRCGPTKPLNYVLRTTVKNPETVRNIQQIYGVSTFKDVPLTASKLGTFAKARIFQPSSEDETEAGQANAIIGSPNGRGVAWLLAQHKDLFGATRQISKIRVWDASEGKANAVVSEGWPNIMFELGGSTAPPSMNKRLDASRRLESLGKSQRESLSNVDTTNAHSRVKHRRIRRRVDLSLRQTPGQHEYYDKDVARGCELNSLMRSPTEDPKYPATGAAYHEIADAGWQMVDSESINRNHRYSQDVMEKLKIPPTTDPSWTYIYWKYEKFSKDHINPKSGKGYRTGGYYSNAYNCDAGMMLAISNNSPRNAQENPALTASDLPVIEKWSDINALTWSEVCGPNKALHYILRLHVNNDESRNVLRITVGLEPPTNKDLGPYPGSTFTPDSDEGLALLGSPNGRGGAFMASQHKALFGATRQVTKISAWGNTQDPDMLFEFGTSEGDIPSAKVDPSAPYNYHEQQAAIPCFVLPCDDSEKRRMALRERAKL